MHLDIRNITILLLSFTIISFLASGIQFVQATPANTITGIFNGEKIYIAENGTNNIIIFYDDKGEIESQYNDLSIKKYVSGGFRMNDEKNDIRIIVTPNIGNVYNIIIKINDGTQKLFGASQIVPYIDPSVNIIKKPTSSIGTDIVSYNIPNDTTREIDAESLFIMALDITKEYNIFFLDDRLEIDANVYSVRNGTGIEGVDVTLEISRDDYIIKSITETTGNNGNFNIRIDDMVYPLFYPKLCYDMKITMQYGNYTTTWKDDFLMYNPNGVDNWIPDLSLLGISIYADLPSSFKTEPRTVILADDNCN